MRGNSPFTSQFTNRLISRSTMLICTTLLAGCAAHLAPTVGNYSPPSDAAVKMQASLQTHKAAAIGIGVIRNGKLVWQGSYGEQAAGVPVTPDTLFNVASLAKPVTAEVVLRLAAAGRLVLDEAMSDIWVDADIANDPRHRKLTPRLALTHRTGFPNWRTDRADNQLAFIAEPGGDFTYSGEGYEYLRRFVEKKTGKSFEVLTEELVFKPVGMNRIAYSERPWMQGHLSIPMNREGVYQSPDLAKAGNPNAADNLFVTITDYAAFMLSVMNNDGLTRDLASERQGTAVQMPPANACKVKNLEGCPTKTTFNLGWTVYQFGDSTVHSNSGMDWGEFALVYIDPATRDGMLYFTNGGNGVKVAMDAIELFDRNSPVAAFGRAQMRN